MNSAFLPKDIEVVVASPGGVGTTFLINNIGRYRKTNHIYDSDGFKHIPVPPLCWNRDTKLLYIFGDPRIATLSLFRRGHQQDQSTKLLRWQGGDPLSDSITIDDYANLGEDRLGIGRQFTNWHKEYVSCRPTMFLRYETLFDNIHRIAAFLELPDAFVNEFPARIERDSSLEDVPKPIMLKLNQIYSELLNELSVIPNVEVLQGNRNNYLQLLRRPYRRATIAQSVDVLRSWKATASKRVPTLYQILKRIKNSVKSIGREPN